MSTSSGFFDGTLNSDTGLYDKAYVAAQFAQYFSLFIGNGVFATPSNQLQVAPSSGMVVKIQSGWAFIGGYWFHNDADLTFTVASNVTGVTRTDGVFIRLDTQTGEITHIYAAGRTTVNRTSPYYELLLATITVASGKTEIVAANITDMRAVTATCGFVSGLIDITDTTDLFAQYDDMFNTWFTYMKTQFTDDAVGGLQTQIDVLKQGVDKAGVGKTWAEFQAMITAGTVDPTTIYFVDGINDGIVGSPVICTLAEYNAAVAAAGTDQLNTFFYVTDYLTGATNAELLASQNWVTATHAALTATAIQEGTPLFITIPEIIGAKSISITFTQSRIGNLEIENDGQSAYIYRHATYRTSAGYDVVAEVAVNFATGSMYMGCIADTWTLATIPCVIAANTIRYRKAPSTTTQSGAIIFNGYVFQGTSNSASNVAFNNSLSGFVANTMQAAMDELVTKAKTWVNISSVITAGTNITIQEAKYNQITKEVMVRYAYTNFATAFANGATLFTVPAAYRPTAIKQYVPGATGYWGSAVSATNYMFHVGVSVNTNGVCNGFYPISQNAYGITGITRWIVE